MPSTLARRRPQVRKGRRYSAAEVHAECVAAVEASGLSQAELAERVGLSAGTISRAMTDASGRYGNSQVTILGKLKGWEIEKRRPDPYWQRKS